MFTLSLEGFRPDTSLARPSAGHQLTYLPATRTSHLQRPEKSATLSLAFAALTSRVKHKSRVCHSYKKHPGWDSPPFCQGFWKGGYPSGGLPLAVAAQG